MDGDAGLTGMHRGAANLRAEIEAARRSLAEAAEALAARSSTPTPAPAPAPAPIEQAAEPATAAELVRVPTSLPVPYRPPTRRRSAAFAGALLATAAVLVRRRWAR